MKYTQDALMHRSKKEIQAFLKYLDEEQNSPLTLFVTKEYLEKIKQRELGEQHYDNK